LFLAVAAAAGTTLAVVVVQEHIMQIRHTS